MNNIDNNNKNLEIKNPEKIVSKSTQIERLACLFENAEEKDTYKQCSNLNDIFKQELEKKGIDFKTAFSKIERPVGTC